MELPDEAKNSPERIISVQVDVPDTLSRSSSAAPEGAGEDRPQNAEWDRSAQPAHPSPDRKDQAERSGPGQTLNGHSQSDHHLHQEDWRGEEAPH